MSLGIGLCEIRDNIENNADCESKSYYTKEYYYC
jgi:hypothetical protein